MATACTVPFATCTSCCTANLQQSAFLPSVSSLRRAAKTHRLESKAVTSAIGWFGGKKKNVLSPETKKGKPEKTGWSIFGNKSATKSGESKSGSKFSDMKKTGGAPCSRCKGVQYIDCPTCDGKGKFSGRGKGVSMKGNILERNKCYDCQGFSMVACPKCSKGGGLTPEQRGER